MYQPLADALRPATLDDVCGQEHILGENGLLRRIILSGQVPNMIFYGPSGTGKTTVANLIAARTQRKLCRLNATTASSGDIKEIYSQLDTFMAPNGVLLYLDEIQYFNKKQQQTLLEYIENGKITLIASTTENPYFYIYNAILSRSSVFEFKPISPAGVRKAIARAVCYLEQKNGVTADAEPGVWEHVASACGGDIRKAMNAVELLFSTGRVEEGKVHLSLEDAKQLSQRTAMRYDKDGDDHYDCLSALMKSIRGSDPDAAIHYLARFLEAGDLAPACRRILCSACEDIGLASAGHPHCESLRGQRAPAWASGGAAAAGGCGYSACDRAEIQFRLPRHRGSHGGCQGGALRPHSARASERPCRRHGL